MSVRRHARFYYDDFLREYPDVYADNDAFATWMRLLVVSEQTWPLPPELPRSVKGRGLQMLVDAGLVALGPKYTFAVLGHDKERSRRHGAAIAGATASAIARANAQATDPASRRQDENKQSSPPPSQAMGRRKDGTNPRAIGTNPRANGTSPRQERDREKRSPAPEATKDILRRAFAESAE